MRLTDEMFDRLTKEISNSGKSKNAIWKEAGLSSYSKLKNITNRNQQSISEDDLILLAEYFHCTVDYLAGKSSDRNTTKLGGIKVLSFKETRDSISAIREFADKVDKQKATNNEEQFIRNIVYILRMKGTYREKIMKSLNELVSVYRQTTVLSRSDELSENDINNLISMMQPDDIAFKETMLICKRAEKSYNNYNFSHALSSYFLILNRALTIKFSVPVISNNKSDCVAPYFGNIAIEKIASILSLEPKYLNIITDFDHFTERLFKYHCDIDKRFPPIYTDISNYVDTKATLIQTMSEQEIDNFIENDKQLRKHIKNLEKHLSSHKELLYNSETIKITIKEELNKYYLRFKLNEYTRNLKIL